MDRKIRFINAVQMALTIKYSSEEGNHYSHALRKLHRAHQVVGQLPETIESPESLARRYLKLGTREPGEGDEWMKFDQPANEKWVDRSSQTTKIKAMRGL